MFVFIGSIAKTTRFMDKANIWGKLSRMTYFDGLFFLHLPDEHGVTERDGAPGIYSLHYCRAGQLLWSQGAEEPCVLPAPVVWWTVPDERYRFGPVPTVAGSSSSEGESWDFALAFTGPRADLMRLGGLIQDDILEPHFLLLQDAGEVERLFLSLLALLESENALPPVDGAQVGGNASPRAVLLLEELLLSLGEQRASTVDLSPLEQAVRDWLDEVKQAPEKEWSVAQGAARLSISQGHFRRLTHRLVGVSPYRFALQRRLDAAARRLRGSKEPIKSLAPACGFKDVNYFSRLFTQRYRLTPAAYRRVNQTVTLEAARMLRRRTLIKSLVNPPLAAGQQIPKAK